MFAQDANVQVIHNSPYAEAAVVDVYINDALALDDFAFRDATPYLSLASGVAVKIDITGSEATDNSSPVFTANFDAGLPAGGTLTLVAAGDPLARDGNPAFDLFVVGSRQAAEMAGNVEFQVFHGSPDAPTVDVVARGAGILVDDISFGETAADYLSVPPASYDLDIQTADNSATAASFNADLSGAADAAITVLASGFLAPATADDPGFGLLAVFADGTTALLPAIDPPPGPMAKLQVVHNSPYAEAAVVDIYLNDALALDDVAFRDATGFLELPAEVAVKLDVVGGSAADNSAPVFTLDLADGLPADATLLAIAAGDPLARDGNPAFDIFITGAREAAETAGNVEAVVFHGSPDAPTVDVAARGVGILVDDISFGEFTDYLSVPPASYDLDIQTADNSATAASFNADLSGAADAAIAVLASGFLAPATMDDPGFGLLAVFADGTTALLPAIDPPPGPMAKLQVVHNSPYAEAAVVDIYLNDALALDDVAFRDATGFLELPAEVAVKLDVVGGSAADNSAPVFTLDLADGLPADATLLAIAAGDPLARDGNPAFDIFITGAREAAETAGNVEAVVFHGSPDAPTVDVAARGVGILVDDISFGEFTDYLSVPPASYDLDIQTADNSATAASFNADLSGAADAAIAVLASGFLAPATMDDPGFGLLAVFADGTTALLPAIDPPVPPMARVQVVHNSPYAEAAEVDVYINDALAIDDFAFRSATGFLDLPAGVPVKIDIAAGSATDNASPVFTLDLADGLPEATLQVVAAGDPLARDGNPAFDLFISAAQEEAASEDVVDLLVFHGSPDAPAVDIVVRGLGTVLDDIAFGQFSDGYLGVPGARYEIDVETADNSVTAASFEAELTGADGAAIAVLASGFLAPASMDDPGFGLLAVFADGTTALLPALVQDVTFTLIDAQADVAIPAFDPMPQDAVLDLSALPSYVNIRANIAETGKVQFDLNDIENYRTESVAPYALCGDIAGDYLPCHLPLGEHVVTASAFSSTGEAGVSGSISFSVVNNGNAVTALMLVDADTNEDLFLLEDGMELDLATVPAHLNVRAETGDKVSSVSFEVGPTTFTRTEVVAPFALFGDISGDYLAGSFANGENTITATPASDGDNEGSALSVTINVTGSGAAHQDLIHTGHSEESAGQETIALDEESFDAQPSTFELGDNYPNPFNPTTTIAFTLPQQGDVQLLVYDMLGREVRTLVNGSLAAGKNEVVFDAAGLPTGTYLYRLTTPQGSITKTMLLVK